MNIENNTNNTNNTNLSPPLYFSKYHKQIVASFYSLFLIFGFVGNLIVIIGVSKWRKFRQQSVANTYILNLALADMLFILTMPFFISSSIIENWEMNTVLCKIANFCREINKLASVFTLVVLSFDRYLASFPGLNQWRSNRFGFIVCLFIWFISAVLSTPYPVFAATRHYNATSICRVKWPTPSLPYEMANMVLQTTIGLLLPVLIIIISYIFLLRRLRYLTTTKMTSTIPPMNRKMTRMVVCVVFVFIVLHTPMYIIEILQVKNKYYIAKHKHVTTTYQPKRWAVMVFIYFNFLAQMAVYINSAINPILYFILNENFRRIYKETLCPNSSVNFNQSIRNRNSRTVSSIGKRKNGGNNSKKLKKSNENIPLTKTSKENMLQANHDRQDVNSQTFNTNATSEIAI